MPTDHARALRIRITFATLSVAAHAVLVCGIGGSRAPDAIRVEPMVDLVGEVTLTSAVSAGAPEPREAPAPAPTPRAQARRESAASVAVTAPAEVLALPTSAPAELTPTASAAAEAASPTTTHTAAGAAAEANGGGGLAAGGGGAALVVDDHDAVRAFVAHVRARVLAARRYPRAAESRGLEGDVYVTIEIARDGSVRVLGIDARDVADALVHAATTAIAEAGPFPIPASVTRASVRARLPIRFHIGE